jgi:hypothetical protein
VQRIGAVAADVVRFGYGGPEELPTVTPAVIAAATSVDTLPVDTFPRRAGTPIGAKTGTLVCVRWRPGETAGQSSTTVLTGQPEALDGVKFSELAQRDGDGQKVDAVAIPDGRSAFVRSARTLGDDGSTGPRFLITDSGVAYGIRDDEAAHALGLTDAEAAPWSIVAHLPSGPELSVDAASVLRDGLLPPS